jgi:hypothetical protein
MAAGLILERAIGGPASSRHLDAASAAGTVRVRSAALAHQAAVIFASEQIDEDPGWQPSGGSHGALIRVA